MRTTFRALALVVVSGWRLGPRQSFLATFEAGAAFLANLLPLALGALIGGLVTGSVSSVAWGAALLVLGVGAAPLLTAIGVEARLAVRERIGHEFDRRVASLLGSLPTVDELDREELQNEIQILKEHEGVLGLAYNALLNALNNVAVPAAAAVVALLSDPRLLLLVPASIPGIAVTRWIVRWDEAAESSGAESARRSKHLLDATSSPTGGAEIRVFDAGPAVRLLLARTTAQWRAGHRRAAARTVALVLGTTLEYLVVASLLLLWIVRDAAAGRIGVGVVATAILAINQMQGVALSARLSYVGLAKVVRTAKRFLWLEREVALRTAEHRGTRPAPTRLRDGIRLDHVTFVYPGADGAALDDIDLFFPAGSVVAIVGESGAGKSTLAKLLAGMHTPTTGRILVDGDELAELDRASWHRASAGAFQDHVRFELRARAVVGVGDVDHIEDDVRVTHALHAAAAEGVVSQLPQLLETPLGTTWPGGVDLSGGQWQRLALARGMMRPEPLLLVLDEPTAALDPVAEDELFTRYKVAAAAAKDRGAVTVLVTHRFSTVRAADLIVVIDGGRVIEEGTHDALVRAGGHYASLYHLQAEGYRP